MHTMRQILDSKGRTIWSVKPENTVYEAIQLMADRRVGALLVLRDSALAGIVSERDYAREVILKGRASRDTRVEQIMSTRVITASSDVRVRDALSLMSNNKIRHLPVVDDGAVTGIVSIGDLVKDVINDQQETIEQLESYIRG
ncbi:MAG: CBS domain-containing protein [Pseudohongiellaceae bacterium]